MTLALLALLACSSPPPSTPKEPVKEAPKPAGATYDYKAQADKLNIILISIDSLRFDRTGLGGSKLTPNIDSFAKEAVQFANATAVAPWTVPATMAIFTGLFPTQHGVVNKLKPNPAGGEPIFDQLRPEIKTFPDMLLAKGWKAAAFTGGAGVSAKFGYNRGGYDTYLDDKTFSGMEYSGPAAKAWLDAHKTDHFFLFFHGYDVHGQHPLLDQAPRAAVPDYQGKLDGGIEEQAKLREQGLAAIKKPGDPPNLVGAIDAEDTRFLTAVYDAKVKEADARVGDFLQHVKDLGLYDSSIIVILADHGEEFMEHGYLDHGATICDHQIRVPLMVRFPKGEGAKVVDAPVRTFDAFPTVFDALGIEGPPDVSGKSLLPLARGEKLDLPIYAESDYRLFVHLRGERKDGKKFVFDLEDGQKSLYDLAADPGELKDLSTEDAKTTYEMEQSVRTWMGSMGTDPSRYLNVQEESIKLF